MRICDVVGCGKKHEAGGFCANHYRRLRRYGDPLGGAPSRGRPPSHGRCMQPGCEKLHSARGLCASHARRLRLYGDPLGGRWPVSGCAVPDCPLPHASKGYCERHYYSLKRYGLSPERYQEFLDRQAGVCAICLRPERMSYRGDPKPLSVDHDHDCCPGSTSCGECVRGLLCSTCNSALGLLGEDPVVISRAVTYLSAKAL